VHLGNQGRHGSERARFPRAALDREHHVIDAETCRLSERALAGFRDAERATLTEMLRRLQRNLS